MVSGADQRPSEEELMRRRLIVLDAYKLAGERSAEVMDAVADARDREDACRSIANLLGITEEAASYVVDVPLWRFSEKFVAMDRAEGEVIRDHLDQGR